MLRDKKIDEITVVIRLWFWNNWHYFSL